MTTRGIVIMDYDNNTPLYFTPTLSRAFVDGVKALVIADMVLQQNFAMVPETDAQPSLTAGSVMADLYARALAERRGGSARPTGSAGFSSPAPKAPTVSNAGTTNTVRTRATGGPLTQMALARSQSSSPSQSSRVADDRDSPLRTTSSGAGAAAGSSGTKYSFKPRTSGYAVTSVGHLLRVDPMHGEASGPLHHLLPDNIPPSKLSHTPVLHTGAVYVSPVDHPWAVRPEHEKPAFVQSLATSPTQPVADQTTAGVGVSTVPLPSASVFSDELLGRSSAVMMMSPDGTREPCYGVTVGQQDGVLLLWRFVHDVVLVLACDALTCNVPLAIHSLSLLVFLLPEALSSAAKADTLSSKAMALHPDLVEDACEVVCPSGRFLTLVDVPLAKTMLQKRRL